MKIIPISNNNIYPQKQITFGERDNWGANGIDPWVIEKRELGKKYLEKKELLDLKLNKEEISLFRYSCELKDLKKWLNNSKKAIDEKWHKVCINYKPQKKNFIQKLLKL